MYTVYKYRYIILILYCLMNMTNNVCWISLQPVAPILMKAYDKDATSINLLTLVYVAVSLLLNFPSNFIFDKLGCRVGIILGTTFSLLGMWIKTLVNHNFWLLIVGQTLAAIG